MKLSPPLAAALSMAIALGACAPERPSQPSESALVEVEPDCVECLRTLTECSSTARNEAQFSACRDVFGACQEKLGLGPETCGRPTNVQGCELCRDRRGECAADDKTCEIEFSVCKNFLMTRERDACSTEPEAAGGSCATCIDALAACAFAGDDLETCNKTFFACRNANSIEPAACAGPTADEACSACGRQFEACGATSSSGCEDGYAKCTASLATEAACAGGASEGIGGEGQGGSSSSGGAEPPAPECPHDACETGAAMSPECDACIAEVCATDSFCCEGNYDAFCVEIAASVPACGCAPAVACEHEVCSTGTFLDPQCDPCAASVCELDGFCCTTEWDALCVSRAGEVCGQTCGT
jgi:hypothetical protein